MFYILQKADGLQVITMYWAGELDVHVDVRGQDRGAGEGGVFCLQAKLSFSCATILVHLSFCPSFGM